jgi:hypothetical protein
MDLGVDVTVFVEALSGLVAVGVVQLNGDARQRSLLLEQAAQWDNSPVPASMKRSCCDELVEPALYAGINEREPMMTL